MPPPSQSSPPARRGCDLLILGDSITLGAAEVRGNEILSKVSTPYVDQLRAALPVLTIAIDADVHRTTSTALPLLPAALANHRPHAVLLMLGGNDADMEWKRFILSKGRIVRNNVPVDRYAQNLRALTRVALDAGTRVILTDMPNHDLSLRGPYFSRIAERDVAELLTAGGGQAESDRRWQLYCAAVTQIAGEMSVELVLYGQKLHELPSSVMVGPDTVHPSGEAHRIIGDMLIEAARRVCVA